MRKIVYTALCGDYDTPKPVLKRTEGWEYWFFTDNPSIIEIEGWDKVVTLPPRKLKPQYYAKKPKICPHLYLPPDHTYSLWVDAAYQIRGNIDSLVAPFTQARTDLAVAIHPSGRTTIYEEAEKILIYGLDSSEILTPHLDRYRAEGFEGNFDKYIYQLGVILRSNREPVHKFNEAWMDEINHGSCRDQISFPYVASKHTDLKFSKFAQMQIDMIMKWYPHNKKINNIYFLSPYGFNLQIGDRLNYEIGALPEDAWVVITDQDACFITDKVGDQLNNIINRYPDTDLFGAYTNRLGLEYQRACSVDEYDLLKLHEIAEERQKKYYSMCTDINKPIAGFFMMFPKKTWEKHKFQPGIIDLKKEIDGKRGIYFDFSFSHEVLKAHGKVRLCEGIFLLHCYRLGKHIKDVNHLTKIV